MHEKHRSPLKIFIKFQTLLYVDAMNSFSRKSFSAVMQKREQPKKILETKVYQSALFSQFKRD